MRVLVTGATGQLGYDVVQQCKKEKFETIGVSSKDNDITNEIDIKKMIYDNYPDVLIHCAAYTAVDKAEEEKERCYDVNVNGTRYIAEICKDLSVKMIYISTDYVFDGSGTNTWKINDSLNPINYYGLTKYLGESEIQKTLQKYFIVRTSWVFGQSGNNFVKTMLHIANSMETRKGGHKSIDVVNDQIGSPTYTEDIAKLLCKMIQTEKYGIYHATNEGYCSWAEFAEEIFRRKGLGVRVNGICSAKYITKAKRPLNSKLDKSSLEINDFKKLPKWQDALQDYIDKLYF